MDIVVSPDVRKPIAILLLAASSVLAVPMSAVEQLCSIEPCCTMPMDCCAIEAAPAPSPDLVLTPSVGVDAAPAAIAEHLPFEPTPSNGETWRASELFESPQPDRQALLSTYLI